MPNPFDFITRPIVGLGRRIGQGIHPLGQYGGADEPDAATLDQVRRALPPSFNGTPNPATLPRPIAPPPRSPGDLPEGRSVSVPTLRRPGEAVTAPEPPRTVGDPAFRAAIREPEVAGLDFSISPNHQTVASPLTDARGRQKMSRPDNTAFRPADYENDPVGRARRDAEIQANFDPKLQSFGGRLKQGLKTGAVAALNSMAQRYAADPRADWWQLLGAGAGGFGAGTAVATANPMAGRGLMFDMTTGPRMQHDIERQHEEEARQIARQKAIADIRYKQRQEQREGIMSSPGGLYDLDNQRVIPGTGASAAVTPVTIQGPDGKPMVIDGRTGKPLGAAYEKPTLQRPVPINQNTRSVYDPATGAFKDVPGFAAGNPRAATPGERRLQINDDAKAKARRDAQADPEWGLRYLTADERRMMATGKKVVPKRDASNRVELDANGQPLTIEVPLTPAEQKDLNTRLMTAKDKEIEQRASYHQQNPESAPTAKPRPGTPTRSLSDITRKYFGQ